MASKSVATKKRKKVWCGLYAPESFNGAFLGETHVYAPESMVGKTISLNLAMFTNDMKKQNIITSFRVKEVKDGKGVTELIAYFLTQAHIKRLVRRRRDKMDDSFVAKSKNGEVLRIKTVAMTNSKTYDSVSSAIRLSLRAKIKKMLKEMAFDEFVNALINVRLQKDWKNSLSKIYPLKFLEVRFVALENVRKQIKESEERDLTEITKEEEIDLSDEGVGVEQTDEGADSQVVGEEVFDDEDVSEGSQDVDKKTKK